MEGHREKRPFGLWESPVGARSLAGGVRFGDVAWSGDGASLLWLEGRSAQGVLLAHELGGDAPRVLSGEHNVRAEVGYGGGDFGVGKECVYFVVHRTGRLYRQSLTTGEARPVTPPFGKAASITVSPDEAWLVYVHSDTEGTDRLAIVDARGRSWPRILSDGHDFYMQPRFSPDGAHLAWIAWDHPRMPWDGSLLYLARIDRSGSLPALLEPRVVAGGDDVAVFQPEFTPDGSALLYVCDETGWGHIWRAEITGGGRRRLTDGACEHGVPAWGQGMRTYAVSADGRFLSCSRSERGFARVHRVDLGTGAVAAVPALEAYGDTAQLSASPRGDRLAFVGSGADLPPRVVLHDFAEQRTRVIARALGETIPSRALSRPEALAWETADEETAHGLFYPPASERFTSSGGPPLIVVIHGGPTGQVRAGWSSQAQFFATRGYALLYVNHRGSTGYGRDYMLRLRRNWGVCDVEDAVSGVAFLGRTGRADSKRCVILGGSAGGFTVLQAMITRPEVFSAGVCLYGVSNQFGLAADTHKFEERYLDSMLGPLPESAAVYHERSPVFHAEKIRRPLALFQGEIDQVVPRNQSDAVVAALRKTGTPHLYEVYEGEGHGWRKAETIERFYNAVERFLREHVLFG